ncbi:ribosomal protein L36 [Streptococcus mitis SK321]|nr:ribosomal protein L36 [Streptococcus mitis SK321]
MTLFVFWICWANYHNTTITTNNFTVFANWFDRWSYFHFLSLQVFRLFKAVSDTPTCQVIWTHFDSNTISR